MSKSWLITRDDLIEILKKDYKADDLVTGFVWGWDGVLEFLDDFELSEEEKNTLDKEIWTKRGQEVDKLVTYVLDRKDSGIVYEPIFEEIASRCLNCGQPADEYASVDDGYECEKCYHRGIEE